MLDGMEDSEPHSYTGVVWIGTVVAIDTTDSGGQCERVKAVVPGLYEANGADISGLPWIQKATSGDYPNGTAFGSCNVPPIGSSILIRLQQDDPHHPEYYGNPQASSTLLALFKINYPNRRGWTDKAGNSLILDNTPNSNTFAYIHASGTTVTIDNAGEVIINSVNEVRAEGPIVKLHATRRFSWDVGGYGVAYSNDGSGNITIDTYATGAVVVSNTHPYNPPEPPL